MVSSYDKEYKNRLKCFGGCSGSEDCKHDLLTQQNKNQSNQTDAILTLEEKAKQKEIEDLMAEAMNQLSFDERQRQLDFLHGVEEDIIENAGTIESALRDLDDHLLLRKHDYSAYKTAERMDPQYVNGKAFRLLFLRCNQYDTKAAAEQMFQFFDIKQKLFGVEKLVKDITIDDLDENDLESLNSGHFRIIGKDRSNRKILFSLPALRSFKHLKNEMRAHFYFKMSLLKSEETQVKGIVGISYEVGNCKDHKNGEGISEMAQISNAIPLFNAALHLAIDDLRTFLVYNLVVKIMPAKVRARFRIHYGSHLECQYRLSTFGISSLLLPLDPNTNAIIQENHFVPYQNHGSNPSGSPIQAYETDVLFTGGRTTTNKGNNRLRSLVTERSELYEYGTNETKRVVVDDIIGKIHVTGGRFLKLIATGYGTEWVVVPIEELRKKITQRFRNKKRAAVRRNSIVDGSVILGDPLPEDVVFGKSQRSRGKDLMQHLIKERFEEYDSLDRGTKMTIVNAIIEVIKANGGRFLLSQAGGYREASDDTVRERISKYFRNHRRTYHGTEPLPHYEP